MHAMRTLGFSKDEIFSVCSVLAAIYHLGAAGAMKGSRNGPCQFLRHSSASKAASILGTTIETLSATIFATIDDRNVTSAAAVDGLDQFVMSLYNQLLHSVVGLMNRYFARLFKSLATTSLSSNHLIVLDTPGFQNPLTCGRLRGATLNDLCQNYLQERLQQLFQRSTVDDSIKLFLHENIECDLGEFTHQSTLASNPLEMTDIIAGKTGSLDSSVVREGTRRRCDLLSFLDENTQQGTEDVQQLLSSFTHQFKGQNRYDGFVRHIQDSKPNHHRLELGHLSATNPVQYNICGWLKFARAALASNYLHHFFHSSSRVELRQLFANSDDAMESVSGTPVERQSVFLRLRSDVDHLIEILSITELHFIYCLLPRHTAGVDQLSVSTMAILDTDDDHLLNVQLLCSQLHGAHIVQLTRLYKLGFSEHMLFRDCLRQFTVLLPQEKRGDRKLRLNKDEKQLVQHLLDSLNVDVKDFKLGLTRVFFQPAALAMLESRRDKKLSEWMLQLQASLRGFLSRKRLQHRLDEFEAIQCIQHNVRAMSSIRLWPWWRLFSKLRPMITTSDETGTMDPNGKKQKLRAELARLGEQSRADRLRREELIQQQQQLNADLKLKELTNNLDVEVDMRRQLEQQLQELSTAIEHRNKQLDDLKLIKVQLEHRCDSAESCLGEQASAIEQLKEAKQKLESSHDKQQQLRIKEKNDKQQEIDELRSFFMKKMRGVEEQLEEESTERQKLQKEKREIEKKLQQAMEQPKLEKEKVQNLNKKLWKTNVLLNDVQVSCEQYEQKKTDASRTAKNAQTELEDLQTLSLATIRAKKGLESELTNLQAQLDSVTSAKLEAEKRCRQLAARNTELESQVSDKEDELVELMKKYRALVQQNTIDLSTLQQQSSTIEELQARMVKHKSDVDTLQMRLHFLEDNSSPKQTVAQLHAKIKELDSRLVLEATCRGHAESLAERTKSRLENSAAEQQRLANELNETRKELTELRKHMRNLQHQLNVANAENSQSASRTQHLEKKLRTVDVECIELSEDLELSSRRIKDLEKVLNVTSSRTSSKQSFLDYSDYEYDDNDDDNVDDNGSSNSSDDVSDSNLVEDDKVNDDDDDYYDNGVV
jgi:myosin-18